MDEPTKKDGIWIKTNRKYNHINCNQNISSNGGTWQLIESHKVGISYNGVAKSNSNITYTTASNGYFYQLNINGVLTQLVKMPNGMGSVSIMVNDSPTIYIGPMIWSLYLYNINTNTFSLYLHINGPSGSYGDVAILNNKVYYANLSSDDSYLQIYCVNDNKVYTYDQYSGDTINDCESYNGRIYVFSTTDYSASAYVHVFDGSSIIRINCPVIYGKFIVWNGKLIIIFQSNFYALNDDLQSWTLLFNSNMSFVHYGKISNTIIGLSTESHPTDIQSIYKFDSPDVLYNQDTVIIQKGNNQNGNYLTAIADTSIMSGGNNRFVSGFDDVFYFADTAFDWNAPMYYGNGSQWIKFKN